MNKFALIVAGGSGQRMNSEIPKQFIPIAGLPILMHTIQKFYNFDHSISILLVLPKSQFLYWDELCELYRFKIKIKLVEGGITRFQSVKKGLNAIDSDGIVAIHDGVRPFVTNEIIKNNFYEAQKNGAALTVVDLKDSIRNEQKALNRNDYKLVQTPQTFNISEIKNAYSFPEKELFTDDASVFESAGGKIYLVNGNYKNIKITTSEDLLIGESFLKSEN